MKTPASTSARILSALEDLIDQEAAALRSGDFVAVAEIQERAAPLVDYIVTHVASSPIGDRGLRVRLLELRHRRNRTSEWLAAEIAHTREELGQTEVHQRRVAQVAPVYGHSLGAARKLSVVG